MQVLIIVFLLGVVAGLCLPLMGTFLLYIALIGGGVFVAYKLVQTYKTT